MIPCRLSLFRFDGENGENAKVEHHYGQAETPPVCGGRFCMLTNDNKPTQITTGIINRIEWKGKVGGSGDENYPECMFYTGSSTYRWMRIEGEDADRTS